MTTVVWLHKVDLVPCAMVMAGLHRIDVVEEVATGRIDVVEVATGFLERGNKNFEEDLR
jgi:hypothetical protein